MKIIELNMKNFDKRMIFFIKNTFEIEFSIQFNFRHNLFCQHDADVFRLQKAYLEKSQPWIMPLSH